MPTPYWACAQCGAKDHEETACPCRPLVVETVSVVDHPSHYTSHPSGIECIDIAQHHNFNVGNAIKYIWRAGLKPAAPGDKATVEDEIRDLEKARKYLEFEIKRLELRLRAVGP